MTDIAVPEDLEPLIYTVNGLDDLRDNPNVRIKPMFRSGDNKNYLVTGDLATIYDINPLYGKGIDGTGQKITVVGQSGVKISDVRTYRAQFGLPANDQTAILVPGYPDPGVTGDQGEGTVALKIAGAIAPNATLLYVYSSTVFYAEQYAVDQNLATVLSSNFSICETNFVPYPSERDAYRLLVQQANAQGITYVALTGDTGPASCETQRKDAAGLNGINVMSVCPPRFRK